MTRKRILSVLLGLSVCAPATSWAQQAPVPGEVIFTELMIAPDYYASSTTSNEWIELYNRTSQPLDLNGCYLYKASSSSTCAVTGTSGICSSFTWLVGGGTELEAEGFMLTSIDAAGLESRCGIQAYADYDKLTLSNSAAEVIELWCPDEEGGYGQIAAMESDWAHVEGADNGLSWQLNQAYLDASLEVTTNPSSWCLAPADSVACTYTDSSRTYLEFGTPGAINNCPEPVQSKHYPGVGEVIFSEINVWPTSSSDGAEWIELYSKTTDVTGTLTDLDGCQLNILNCTSNGLSDEECLAEVGYPYADTLALRSETGSLPLSYGQRVLLVGDADSGCASWDTVEPTKCLVYGDLLYSNSTFTLPASDTRLLDLTCPDSYGIPQTIDRMLYSGSEIKYSCSDDHARCSWQLSEDSFDASLNDNRYLWSVAPPETQLVADWVDGLPVLAYGTPKATNILPTPVPPKPHPAPGDVIFSELNFWPTSSSVGVEWLELDVLNAGSGETPYDLESCQIGTLNCSSEGLSQEECLAASITTYGDVMYIVPDGESYPLTTGEKVLLVGDLETGCAAWDPADSTHCLVTGDLLYSASSFTLPASDLRLLDLSCPNEDGVITTIDRVVYSGNLLDDQCLEPDGRCSWELDEATADATLNDDTANWGAAPLETLYVADFTGTVAETAYGTPDADNVLAPPVPPPARPLPGEVVFSELSYWPTSSSGGAEWIELEVLSSGNPDDRNDLHGCLVGSFNCTAAGISDAACLAQGSITYSDSVELQVESGSLTPDAGSKVLVVGSTDGCAAYDPADSSHCLISGDVAYSGSSFTLASTDTRLLELSCPDEEGNLNTVDRILYSGDDLDDRCQEPSGRCSWELPEESMDGTLNDDRTLWNVAPPEAPYISYYSDGLAVGAYGTPGSDNIMPIPVPPVPHPAPGEVVFSELNIWPTSSSEGTEWIELEVLSAGTGDTPNNLQSCQLGIFNCSAAGLSDADCQAQTTVGYGDTQLLEPPDNTLPLTSGEKVLLVGDTTTLCASWDSADLTHCLVTGDVGYSASGFALPGSDTRLLDLLCPTEDGTLQVIDRILYNGSEIDDRCTEPDGRCSWALDEAQMNASSNDDRALWNATPADATYVNDVVGDAPLLAYGTPGADNILPPPIIPKTHPGPGDVVFSELNIWPTSSSPSVEWIEFHVNFGGDGEVPNDLESCQLSIYNCSKVGLSNEAACLASNPAVFDDTLTLSPEDGSIPLTTGGKVLLVGDLEDDCAKWDPADQTQCLVHGDFTYNDGSFGLPTTDLRLLQLSCPGTDGQQVGLDRIAFEGDAVKALCEDSSGRCSWELSESNMDPVLNDDSLSWNAAPLESAYIAEWQANTSSGTEPTYDAVVAYGTPGSANLGNGQQRTEPIPAGALAFTEFSIWASSSSTDPDWVELQVEGVPQLYPFGLESCSLRTATCPDSGDCLADDAGLSWSDAAITKAPGSDGIYLYGGETVLIGSSSASGKLCVSIDGNQDCLLEVDGTSGEAELTGSSRGVLELSCPDADGNAQTIDRVLFDRTWVTPLCSLNNEHCSWALRTSGVTGLESYNDLPQNWTAGSVDYGSLDGSVARGTPGQPNVEAPLPELTVPAAGDLAFSEILVRAATGSSEWFELQAVSSGSYQLSGCMFIEATTAAFETCNPETVVPGDSVCASYQIPSELSVSVGGDARALFVKSDGCVSYDGTPPAEGQEGICLVSSDLSYANLDFGISEPGTVGLWCPDGDGYALIDSLTWNWDKLESSCPYTSETGSCSISIQPEQVTAELNDDPLYQCISPAETTFKDSTGLPARGTPGEANVCEDVNLLEANALVFTELMFAPLDAGTNAEQQANEWFELYNPGASTVSLEGCSLVLRPYLTDGSVDHDPGNEDRYELSGLGITIGSGTYQVWGADGCLFTDNGVCQVGTETQEALGYVADVGFSGLSFVNSAARQFSLECQAPAGGVTVVDAFKFDGSVYETDDGHSWQLQPSRLTAEGNDDPNGWCEASFAVPFWPSDGSAPTNYGTPGKANDCTGDPDETPGPNDDGSDDVGTTCVCDAGGTRSSSKPGELALALLVGLGMWTRRRRT